MIRKRGKTWMFTVEAGFDPVTGKRRRPQRSGFKTRKEAEYAQAAMLAKIRRGEWVQDSQETVGEFLTEWLTSIAGRVRPTTLTSYERNIRVHVRPTLGQKRLQALTSADLNSLYGKLLLAGRRGGANGLRPRTVRYIHTILRGALKDALRWNRVARNVADAADPPSHSASKPPEMATWTAAELKAFLKSVQGDRLSALWRVLAMTGMRRGEACGLQWKDIDLKNGRVSVQRSLIQSAVGPSFAPPKTERGRRAVALDTETASALKDHRASQAAEKLLLGAAYQDQGLVFCREDGRPLDPDGVSKAFTKRRSAAGLVRIRLHDLRHTHATLALQAGVHPKVVSDRLGHGDVALTLNTYSHAIPALQESAAETGAALISG